MAYRIGNSRGHSTSGAITGAYVAAVGSLLPGDNSDSGGGGSCNFSASDAAGGISVGGQYIDGTDGHSYVSLSASVGGGGTGTPSGRILIATPNSSHNTAVSGSYEITCTIEDWFEAGEASPGSAFTDHGVLRAELDLHGRVFQRLVEGSAVTATVTAGGSTATMTRTAGAGEDFGDGEAQCSATAVYAYDPPVGTGLDIAPHSYAGGITCTSTGLTFDGPTATSAAGSLSCSGGASFSLNEAGVTRLSATAGGRRSPTKAGSVVGRVNAVRDPWAGTVDISCPVSSVDASPEHTAGADWSLSVSQRRHSYGLGLDETNPGAEMTYIAVSDVVEEYAPLTPTLDSSWCLASGEYVTYPVTDDADNVAIFRAPDSAMRIHGPHCAGLTVSLPSVRVIDDCTSATGWTGAALTGGHLTNSGTGAMTRAFSPWSHWGAYRYLRLHVGSSAGPANRLLTIGGKTWTVPIPATPADVQIDLCCPASPSWTADAQDTLWPEPNPSFAYTSDSPAAEGPGWGCTFVTGFSLTGFAAGETVTLSGVSLVRQGALLVDVLPEWAPRFDEDAWLIVPSETNDSETVTTNKVWRGLAATADAVRQSAEVACLRVTHVEPGSSGADPFYLLSQEYSVADYADWLAASGVPAGTREPSGWAATVDAPVSDGSDDMADGYLNRNLPGYFLWGAGLLYTPGDSPWSSGVDLDASGSLALPLQVLMTQVDWTGLTGDVFGYGASGATAPTWPVHKILRAQARGGVLDSAGVGAASKSVKLYPGAGELQPSGTAVGSDTTGSDGGFLTAGPGLDGYTTTGTDPSTVTVGSGGVVVDETDG